MLRLAAFAIAVLVALAGCSNAPGPTATQDEATSQSATSESTSPPLEIIRTDTLHLLGSPHMAGLLPENQQTYRTPLPSQSLGIEPAPSWSLPLPDLEDFQTTIHLYVDVQGVVTAGSTAGPICFWNLGLLVTHTDGRDPDGLNVCFAEEAIVPTGIRALDFSLALTLDVAPQEGDRLALLVSTNGAYAPGASVSLLSGTSEHDSTLTIEGLQLPLDTQTYFL